MTATILALTLDKRLAWAVHSNGRTRTGQIDLAPSRTTSSGRRWINMCTFVDERIEGDGVEVICYPEPKGVDAKAMLRLGGYVAHLQVIAERQSVTLRAVKWIHAATASVGQEATVDVAEDVGIDVERLLSQLPKGQVEALRVLEYVRRPVRRRKVASLDVSPRDEPDQDCAGEGVDATDSGNVP